MKILLLIFLFVISSIATVPGCEKREDIEGFWRAIDSGGMEPFKYMYKHKCANVALIIKNGGKIVERGLTQSRICSDDNYCYWVDNEFFKEGN